MLPLAAVNMVTEYAIVKRKILSKIRLLHNKISTNDVDESTHKSMIKGLLYLQGQCKKYPKYDILAVQWINAYTKLIEMDDQEIFLLFVPKSLPIILKILVNLHCRKANIDILHNCALKIINILPTGILKQLVENNLNIFKRFPSALYEEPLYYYQTTIFEILLKCMTVFDDSSKAEMVKDIFGVDGMFSKFGGIFLKLDYLNFDLSARTFLNALNMGMEKCKIYSIAAVDVFMGPSRIQGPIFSKKPFLFWIDWNIFNMEISFFVDQSNFITNHETSHSWTLMKILKDNFQDIEVRKTDQHLDIQIVLMGEITICESEEFIPKCYREPNNKLLLRFVNNKEASTLEKLIVPEYVRMLQENTVSKKEASGAQESDFDLDGAETACTNFSYFTNNSELKLVKDNKDSAMLDADQTDQPKDEITVVNKMENKRRTERMAFKDIQNNDMDHPLLNAQKSIAEEIYEAKQPPIKKRKLFSKDENMKDVMNWTPKSQTSQKKRIRLIRKDSNASEKLVNIVEPIKPLTKNRTKQSRNSLVFTPNEYQTTLNNIDNLNNSLTTQNNTKPATKSNSADQHFQTNGNLTIEPPLNNKSTQNNLISYSYRTFTQAVAATKLGYRNTMPKFIEEKPKTVCNKRERKTVTKPKIMKAPPKNKPVKCEKIKRPRGKKPQLEIIEEEDKTVIPQSPQPPPPPSPKPVSMFPPPMQPPPPPKIPVLSKVSEIVTSHAETDSSLNNSDNQPVGQTFQIHAEVHQNCSTLPKLPKINTITQTICNDAKSTKIQKQNNANITMRHNVNKNKSVNRGIDNHVLIPDSEDDKPKFKELPGEIHRPKNLWYVKNWLTQTLDQNHQAPEVQESAIPCIITHDENTLNSSQKNKTDPNIRRVSALNLSTMGPHEQMSSNMMENNSKVENKVYRGQQSESGSSIIQRIPNPSTEHTNKTISKRVPNVTNFVPARTAEKEWNFSHQHNASELLSVNEKSNALNTYLFNDGVKHNIMSTPLPLHDQKREKAVELSDKNLDHSGQFVDSLHSKYMNIFQKFIENEIKQNHGVLADNFKAAYSLYKENCRNVIVQHKKDLEINNQKSKVCIERIAILEDKLRNERQAHMDLLSKFNEGTLTLIKRLVYLQKQFELYESKHEQAIDQSIHNISDRSNEMQKKLWNQCLEDFKRMMFETIEKFQE